MRGDSNVLLVALILKTNIEQSFVNESRQKEYNVISLQRNPFLKTNIEQSFVNESRQKEYNVISLQRNPYIKP